MHEKKARKAIYECKIPAIGVMTPGFSANYFVFFDYFEISREGTIVGAEAHPVTASVHKVSVSRDVEFSHKKTGRGTGVAGWWWSRSKVLEKLDQRVARLDGVEFDGHAFHEVAHDAAGHIAQAHVGTECRAYLEFYRSTRE